MTTATVLGRLIETELQSEFWWISREELTERRETLNLTFRKAVRRLLCPRTHPQSGRDSSRSICSIKRLTSMTQPDNRPSLVGSSQFE
jgi:hypothetical protein